MVYLPWLVIRLIPLWLGPIIGWLTQKTGARPVFEPFTPGRHVVPEDVAASFRQICDGLTTECCAAAVRALEQLAGGKATPVVGIDSVGDSVVKIGRASCRERVWIAGLAVSIKKEIE